ncbi:hypothetical protein BaRGS_00025208 [Batillaria attramentaria]|uniref:Uncharacterized protein n=1 Tax=Batillaria attramentaria TaxID=370345 RepID=A0ABD0K8U7_9CAEN
MQHLRKAFTPEVATRWPFFRVQQSKRLAGTDVNDWEKVQNFDTRVVNKPKAALTHTYAQVLASPLTSRFGEHLFRFD